MKFKTADLCDKNKGKVVIADVIGLKNYGKNKRFYGKMQTLQCYEDHGCVEKILETDGTGKVLVVHGEGSLHCALVGDRLASLAIKNNWNGVIVYGAIRDSVKIGTLPIGLLALATYPISKVSDNNWQENIHVHFAGITFSPGNYVYCDEDGVITSPVKLL